MNPQTPDLGRFLHHLREEPQYSFFVTTAQYPAWVRVFGSREGFLWGEGVHVPLDQVLTCVAAYPSGEILAAEGRLRYLPAGTHIMPGPVYHDDSPDYRRGNVRNGWGGVIIAHEDSPLQPEDWQCNYATRIRNATPRRIRVYKFCFLEKGLFGLRKKPEQGYYSPRQFREWFRVPDPEGWIAPSEVVCDPYNYGSGSGAWAYFFETDTAEKFIGTAEVERRRRDS
jgi:hypothetical protein